MTVMTDIPDSPLPSARRRANRTLAGLVIAWLRANLFASIPSTDVTLRTTEQSRSPLLPRERNPRRSRRSRRGAAGVAAPDAPLGHALADQRESGPLASNG